MGMETWRRAVLAATAVAKAKNGTQLCVFGENQMMTGRPGRRVGPRWVQRRRVGDE